MKSYAQSLDLEDILKTKDLPQGEFEVPCMQTRFFGDFGYLSKVEAFFKSKMITVIHNQKNHAQMNSGMDTVEDENGKCDDSTHLWVTIRDIELTEHEK